MVMLVHQQSVNRLINLNIRYLSMQKYLLKLKFHGTVCRDRILADAPDLLCVSVTIYLSVL